MSASFKTDGRIVLYCTACRLFFPPPIIRMYALYSRSVRYTYLQCSDEQVSAVEREENARCAPEGSEGRTDGLNRRVQATHIPLLGFFFIFPLFACSLALIKVGWRINGRFHEQVKQFQKLKAPFAFPHLHINENRTYQMASCVDESTFATLWTRNRVHGKSSHFKNKRSKKNNYF